MSSKRPNILLVFPDQVRSDWIEPVSGVPVRTPNVRALAERGTLFSMAWTPSPICAPARACIATGRNYDRSPVRHNNENVPPRSDTLYRRLAQSGYAVSTTGKLDLLKGFMDWGTDGQHFTAAGDSRLRDLGFTGGIDSAGKHDCLFGRERNAKEPFMTYLAGRELDQVHFDDYRNHREPGEYRVPIGDYLGKDTPPPPAYACTDPTPLPEDAYGDNWIGRQGLAELRRLAAGEKPWFLVVNFSGPHEPLDVTSRMQARWQDVDFPMPHGRPVGDPDLHRRMRQNYAAMIELIDDWLGIYVGELQEQGALENTLVVYASDHGEMLGDFNLWAKSVPHEASVRVPLVMAGPGCRPAGEPCAAPVSLLDMGKTFLDVAGCDMTGFEGVSLRPTLQTGAAPARDLVYSGLGNWRAVSDGRFKLVAGFSQDVVAFMTQFAIFDPASITVARLYDLDADPLEEHDVSARHPEIYRQLSEAIAADCGMPSQSTHQKNRTGDQVPS